MAFDLLKSTDPSKIIIGKRIRRSAQTHHQLINDVTDSFVIPEKYQHLQPCVENAVKMVVDYANNIRQKRAASQLIGAITRAELNGYVASPSASGYMPTSEGQDCWFIAPEVDKDGNINRGGSWYYGMEADAHMEVESDTPDYVRDFNEDDARLAEMVEAANSSQVFVSLGIELVILDGALIGGGHTD